MNILRMALGAVVTPCVAIALAILVGCNFIVLNLADLLGLSTLLSKWEVRRRYGAIARSSAIDLARANAIVAAFALPGETGVAESPLVVAVNGRLGVRVELLPARGAPIANPKYAYYVEGSHFEMGVLLGMLAAPAIRRMSEDYLANVVFDFAKAKRSFPGLGRILADLLYSMARYTDALVPDEMSAEIWGLWQGMHLVEKRPGSAARHLFVLNYGIDILLSWVYSGADGILKLLGFDPAGFSVPFGCNGFAAFGPKAAAGSDQADPGRGGYWFGRDFMFPTCGETFGACAAHIVYNGDGQIGPRQRRKAQARGGDAPPYRDPKRLLLHSLSQAPGHGLRRSRPQLVFSAPGMVGAVTALNDRGLCMGLDMINQHNCSWSRVGINSMMMVRYAIQYSDDSAELVKLMARLPRGVTWLYLLADGGSDGDKAVAIEAGMKTGRTDFLRYTPAFLQGPGPLGKPALPDQAFIDAHSSGPFHKGMMLRWHDWEYDKAWLGFNEELFRRNGKPWDKVKGQWGPDGMICATPTDDDIPGTYYFPPQREDRDDLMLAGNNFLVPEMRLMAMSAWTNLVGADFNSDFQWRYDTLNRLMRKELAMGPLSRERARDTINFLRPYDGKQPAAHFSYYGVDKHSGRPIPPDQVLVYGNINLVDLRALSMETLYDRYADPWVRVSLARFAQLP